MASYEKRNNTWSVRFREDTCNGKMNRRMSGFESQEAAEAAFNEWEENYNSRIANSNITPKTFEELLSLYIERSKGRNKESSYYTTLSKINSHIRPFFFNYTAVHPPCQAKKNGKKIFPFFCFIISSSPCEPRRSSGDERIQGRRQEPSCR